MLRVGYPAVIPVEMLGVFPEDVELIALPDGLDHTVELDVWIPDPYANKAVKIWPQLRGVKLVLSLMAGTEWIPGTCGPDVIICSGRGAHSTSTAEWTLTAILAMLKHLPFYDEVRRQGAWKRRFESPAQYAVMTGDQRPLYPPVMLEELTGKRVLLVGHGSIGKEIERLLEPFHVELTRVARSPRKDPAVHAVSELDSLLPKAEVVILILPLTAESRHLISTRQLELLPQGALVVNAARGPVVDTDALVAALQAGKVRAALDVTDPEPLPEGHPLWSCPNLLITPHVAGSTPQFAPRSLQVAAEELARYRKGEELLN
ncbi:NAD(P)-dependent oxidoreductase [Telmatobacter bradus]|uniref:NAD(P)-dependent oxidoreductase n=1 Tax=Telmatobacter bradus TaxID=474953 RepID=UPI003B432B6A